MKKTFAILSALLMLTGFGCSKKVSLPKTPEQIESEKFSTLPNYFLLDPQSAGMTIKVTEAKFAKPGFMVVREMTGGQPGTILGFSSIVPQGDVQNVKIAIMKKLDPTGSYAVEMHDDTDGDTNFNQKKDLALYNPENGEVIRKTITIQ